MKPIKICLALSVFFVAGWLLAADKVITIESKITGSQEQPRVISIVPWQQIKTPQYLGKELDVDLIGDVYKPLRRDDFVSEIQYISATRQ